MDGFDDLDSGGELDIEEDPDFPLPHYSDSENESDDERLPHDPDPSDSDVHSPGPSDSTAHNPSPSSSDEDHLDTDLDDNLGEGK